MDGDISRWRLNALQTAVRFVGDQARMPRRAMTMPARPSLKSGEDTPAARSATARFASTEPEEEKASTPMSTTTAGGRSRRAPTVNFEEDEKGAVSAVLLDEVNASVDAAISHAKDTLWRLAQGGEVAAEVTAEDAHEVRKLLGMDVDEVEDLGAQQQELHRLLEERKKTSTMPISHGWNRSVTDCATLAAIGCRTTMQKQRRWTTLCGRSSRVSRLRRRNAGIFRLKLSEPQTQRDHGMASASTCTRRC